MFTTPTDRTRPAVAVIDTTYGPGAGTGNGRYFCGYWQPDGSWADIDGGPGGEGLAEAIAHDLDQRHPTVRALATVRLTIQSFATGELVSATYHASDLDASAAMINLPTCPDPSPGPRFRLSIELGNAAMQNGRDVADALRDLAGVVDGRYTDAHGAVLDHNGNMVGRWSLSVPNDDDDDGDPADVCSCGEPRELHKRDGAALLCPDVNGEFELSRGN